MFFKKYFQRKQSTSNYLFELAILGENLKIQLALKKAYLDQVSPYCEEAN